MAKKKLLDILVDKIRFKHYSKSTEETYKYWCKNYILYHNKKHPKYKVIREFFDRYKSNNYQPVYYEKLPKELNSKSG